MKTFCKYLVIAIMIIVSILESPIYAQDTTNDDLWIKVEYLKHGNTIVELNTFCDGDNIQSYTRRISLDGTVEIIRNNKPINVFRENSETYLYYLKKVGSKEVYNEKTIATLILMMSTSNYGCGYNDKIHQFIGSVTNTIYRSDIDNSASALSIAYEVAAILNMPISAALYLASNLLDLFANQMPYKLIITKSMFDVKQPGSMLHLFFCYHVYTSCYNGNNVFLGATETYYQEI